VAFLIVRNDSILFEKYFDNYSPSSQIPSFSVAKSFVSALIGIAVGEKSIQSIDQHVVDYLPELKDNPGFDKIRIRDLLNMRSGIEFSEAYGSPFAPMAKYYYGTNLKKYVSRLKTKSLPDQHYEYQSVNALLLTLILEKATGKPASQYFGRENLETRWNGV